MRTRIRALTLGGLATLLFLPTTASAVTTSPPRVDPPSTSAVTCNDDTWAPGFHINGTDNRVYAITAYRGDIVACGTFTVAGRALSNRVARWNGTQWDTLGAGMDGPVTALVAYGGNLVAAGDFTKAGSNPAARIARWDGIQWNTLGGAGVDYPVKALAVLGSKVIVGGDFLNAGGSPASHIAQWDT